MAGSLTISTLKDSSGVLATQNGMTGIAKAWVQFVGSTGTINGSFNISSVTRNTTGNYTLNFTTAMANINYAVAVSASPSGANATYPPQVFSNAQWSTLAPTTSAFSMLTPVSTTNLADIPYVCAVVFSS